MKKKIMFLTLLLVALMATVSFAENETNEVIADTSVNQVTEAEATTEFSGENHIQFDYSNYGNFGDVPSNHWAIEYIYEARNKGVINGYPNGTFAPENDVTVGEFIKMVATTYFKSYNYVAPTDGSHWSMPYVNSLDRIVLNKDNYDYATLERVITRAEAARLLCMLHYRTHNVELDKTFSSVSNFADEATITDRTDRLAIDNCVKYGLINGHAEDNTFRPLEGLTRCQAAKILMLTITR